MVVNVGKYRAASGGNQVLITSIVSVNKMHRPVKGVQVAEHKRRNKIATVYQDVCLRLIGLLNRCMQVRDLVVAIG